MTPRPSDIVRSNFTHPRYSGGGSLANNQFVMWNILSRNNSIGQTWQLSLWQNASTTIQQFATNKSPNLVKTYYNASFNFRLKTVTLQNRNNRHRWGSVAMVFSYLI